MLELESVREIVSTLKWMLTLGASEIKQVKEDIRELIQELSKSLTNLWDLTTKITTLPEGELNKASFETLYDYFGQGGRADGSHNGIMLTSVCHQRGGSGGP